MCHGDVLERCDPDFAVLEDTAVPSSPVGWASTLSLTQTRRAKTVVLQQAYRCHCCRKRLVARAFYMRRYLCATTIQSSFRVLLSRRIYRKLCTDRIALKRSALRVICGAWCVFLCRRDLRGRRYRRRQEVASCSVLSAAARRRLAQLMLHALYASCARTLQVFIRKLLRIRKAAGIVMKVAARRLVARVQFVRVINSACMWSGCCDALQVAVSAREAAARNLICSCALRRSLQLQHGRRLLRHWMQIRQDAASLVQRNWWTLAPKREVLQRRLCVLSKVVCCDAS